MLLRLLLRGSLHQAFAGDLEERFHREATKDRRAARRAYWGDVLSPTVLRLRREARGMHLPPGSPATSGRGDGIVSALLADLQFALRTLAQAPSFTAVAVVSLALGIGPNTAIFSLVDAVLFQGWGVDDPDRIVDIYTLNRDGQYFFSRYATYELIEEGTPEVFEGVAAHSLFVGRFDGADGGTDVLLGEMVTGEYFDVMGVTATAGRTFLPEEDQTLGTHPVLVVSDRLWRTRYGADPALVNGEIRLNGRPYTVIGIAPPSFRGRLAPGLGTDFWVPFRMYPHLSPDKMGSGDLTISGRVRDGVAPGQAVAAVQTVAARFNQESLEADPDRRGELALAAVPLSDVLLHPNFDDTLSAMALLLFTAVGLVLLVACVNLAGFFLSRAVERRKEMAVRVAMGAGRLDIVRQLLVESLLLAGLGGALGLALGMFAMHVIAGVEFPLPVPITLHVGLSGRLFAFTAGTAVVAAVLFGLTPALEATRAPVAATLRDEAGASGGKKKVGIRGILVAAQMGLSTILLIGAALFVRSLGAAVDLDVGFDTGPAAVITVETEATEYTPGERVAFVDELERRLGARPTVTSFGLTGRMPLDLGMMITSFDVPGVDPPPDQDRHRLESTPVTRGYFEAMQIPILDGRAFVQADREGSQQVVILSSAAAAQYWPRESAVGKVLFRGGDPEDALVVAGVAGDVKIWSLAEPPRPYMYLPYHQAGAFSTFQVVARGTVPAGELAAIVRDEARAIDPEIFLSEVETMEDHLAYIYFLPRMAAGLLSLVGALALLLACIGLYGMVSYGVSRRVREMGIRLALGADRRSVVNLILRGGLTLVLVGGVIGIAASLGLGRLVGAWLYGAGGLDPISILAAPLVLGAVAAAAAYVPARRASRVDPVRALRTE